MFYFFWGDSDEFSSIVNDPFLFNSNVTLVNVLDPLESPTFSPKINNYIHLLLY